jgi:hypothetical protein
LRLPTFLIIGAPKTGTTSLYTYLRQHPAIFMSYIKEPHFFSYLAGDKMAGPLLPKLALGLRTIEDYASLFAGAGPEQIAVGEASTGYLGKPGIAEVIHKHLPDVRLIAILRDPAERAFSNYLMHRRLRMIEDPDFERFVRSPAGAKILWGGYYGRFLRDYLAVFPREQLMINLQQDLDRDRERVVADVMRFIGVDARPVDISKRQLARPSNDRMSDAAHAWLRELYRQDTQEAQDLIGRDLSGWLRPRT